MGRSSRFLLVIAVALTTLMVAPVAAEPIGTNQFLRTWERADRPVAELVVNRTWIWGPEASTGVLIEDYADAPNGQRQVQYFDKTRMEDNSWRAGPPWDVTNGLLAKELITGEMQTGDNSFELFEPAQVNVAGDPDDPNGPTYATFNGLMNESPFSQDSTITQTVDRQGNISSDTSLASYGVTAAHHVSMDGVNHRVASVFWDFMNSSGLIYENGEYINAPLSENPFYIAGYPLTEAYWTTVRVANVPKPVLVQVFERRVLTYTPDNPVGWQVEAGNVGQHYYRWRNDQQSEPLPPPVEPEFESGTVTAIVDGDTIDVSLDGIIHRVRLIGVDTPAAHGVVECYGTNAMNFTSKQLLNKTVQLETDVAEIDDQGRLLRYVWLDSQLFNQILVRQGYGYATTTLPNVKYAEQLAEAQNAAESEGKGLWRACDHTEPPLPTLETTGDVRISYVFADPTGPDSSGEYVAIRNYDDNYILMEDWVLRDGVVGNEYVFPYFILAPGASVWVHNCSGIDTSTDLYWWTCRPIWDNAGDNAYLINADGGYVDIHIY